MVKYFHLDLNRIVSEVGRLVVKLEAALTRPRCTKGKKAPRSDANSRVGIL